MSIDEPIQGCKLLHLSDDLSFDGQEGVLSLDNQLLSFAIKGVYYSYQMPEGKKMSFEALKNVKQFIFCPIGHVKLYLENKHGKTEVDLSDSKTGILIEECAWREVLCLQKNSVLCVLTSENIKPENRLSNYEEFLEYIS